MRKDRINVEEPKPKTGEPARPELTTRAADHWTRIAPELLRVQILTIADGEAFGMLCELLATRDLVVVEKSSKEFKPFVIEPVVTAGDTHLKIKEHPALAVERKTAAALKAYFSMFGLEPTARSRIRAPQAPQSTTQGLRDFARQKGPLGA